MITRTVKYKDYFGKEQTDELCFHMKKAELIDLEYSVEGGWGEKIMAIIKSKDNASIAKAFKEVFEKSFGRISEDGKRFVKDPQITKEFMESEAYDTLFMELLSNPEDFAKFCEGILPTDLVAEAKKAAEEKKEKE